MSEKKVHFSEESLLAGAAAGDAKSGDPVRDTRFKEKHSLDSDEEDNVDPYQVMDEDDIEGQEDSTIDYDGGNKITPFNMKDELEEGHFDSEGTYIFNKEKEIRDEWLDNIDWVKIHRQSHPEKRPLDDDSSDEEASSKVDMIALYRQVLELMKPKETVSKALRRLGGGKAGISASSASQRLKAKKTKTETDPEKEAEEKANKEKVEKLSGLADNICSTGNMEIYQETYERLSFLVKNAEEEKAKSKPVIPDDVDSDDALDMFADDIDKKNPEINGSVESSEKSGARPSSEAKPSSSKPAVDLDEVKWEYKWKEDDDEIHGPFTSQQMADWVEDDYFPDGVFVRKTGSNSNFYTSKRMDFELYT